MTGNCNAHRAGTGARPSALVDSGRRGGSMARCAGRSDPGLAWSCCDLVGHCPGRQDWCRPAASRAAASKRGGRLGVRFNRLCRIDGFATPVPDAAQRRVGHRERHLSVHRPRSWRRGRHLRVARRAPSLSRLRIGLIHCASHRRRQDHGDPVAARPDPRAALKHTGKSRWSAGAFGRADGSSLVTSRRSPRWPGRRAAGSRSARSRPQGTRR